MIHEMIHQLSVEDKLNNLSLKDTLKPCVGCKQLIFVLTTDPLFNGVLLECVDTSKYLHINKYISSYLKSILGQYPGLYLSKEERRTPKDVWPNPRYVYMYYYISWYKPRKGCFSQELYEASLKLFDMKSTLDSILPFIPTTIYGAWVNRQKCTSGFIYERSGKHIPIPYFFHEVMIELSKIFSFKYSRKLNWFTYPTR